MIRNIPGSNPGAASVCFIFFFVNFQLFFFISFANWSAHFPPHENQIWKGFWLMWNFEKKIFFFFLSLPIRDFTPLGGNRICTKHFHAYDSTAMIYERKIMEQRSKLFKKWCCHQRLGSCAARRELARGGNWKKKKDGKKETKKHSSLNRYWVNQSWAYYFLFLLTSFHSLGWISQVGYRNFDVEKKHFMTNLTSALCMYILFLTRASGRWSWGSCASGTIDRRRKALPSLWCHRSSLSHLCRALRRGSGRTGRRLDLD